MAITFNEAYYLQNNPDVTTAVTLGIFKSGQDHFSRIGGKENRNPNAVFDSAYYAAQNPDVAAAVASGVFANVFAHYLASGVNEGRLPSAAFASFDSARYLKDNADIAAAGITSAAAALKHYVQFGVDEGRVAYDTAGSLIVLNSGTGNNNSSFTLTNGTDVATANVFQAGLVYTPGGNDRINSLQDEDVLNGTGTNPTLNATLGNSNDNGATTITPKLNGIQTLNLGFTGSGATAVQVLDVQDATGIKAVNITRITENSTLAHVRNMTSVPTNLSVTNTVAPSADVAFTFTNAGAIGATDSTTLTITDISVDRIRVEENATGAALDQGVETINLVSNGSANQLGQYTTNSNTGVDGVTGRGFAAQDLTTLNITGAAATTIINITNADSTLTTVDASKATGALDINIASELASTSGANSGASIALKATGGTANDTFRVGAGLGSTDSIDGGTGTDTLRVYSNASATLVAGTITNTEVLDIRVNDPLVGTFAAGAATLTANTASVGGLTSIVLRNDGSAASGGQVDFSLTNVSATIAGTAANTTLRHGTTGNNDVADTKVTFALASTSGTSDTVAMTLVSDVNTDLTSSFELGAANVENITIADSDTESNSVLLTNTANHTGTVTLTGGSAGKHFGVNVDVVTTASFNNFGGTSTTNLSDLSSAALALAGGSVAAADVVAATVTAGAYTGNVAIRVGQPTTTNGPQSITLGSGNDLVVFNNDVDARAGLTISDTVVGGTGTDTLRIDSNLATGVTLSQSEFTNVSGFEALQLRGTTAYNVTLSASLTAASTTFTVDHVDRSIANGTATIDARAITTGLRFYGESDYDYTSAFVHSTTTSGGNWADVAETIILNDANTNGTVLIDGGDSFGRAQNLDVLQIRNAAVVSTGDLSQVSDIGFIEFRSDAAVAQAYVLELNTTILDKMDSSQAASSTARETFTVRVVPNTDTLSSADTLTLDASTVTDSYNLTVAGSRGDNIVTLGAGNDTYVLFGGFAAGTYTGSDAAGRSLTGASDFNGTTAGEGMRTATATESINLGTGTDTLVTYGAINLAAATLTGVENIIANSTLVITAAQYRAIVAAGGTITFQTNLTHNLRIIGDGGAALDLSKINLTQGSLVLDTRSTGGVSNTTTGSVNDTSTTGDATTGTVATDASNGAAPTPSTTTTISAAGTYTGSAGTNDTFATTIALLTGTTITGTTADTETLQLTDAGTVNLNNAGAGGTLSNLDNLVLANGTNTITFTGSPGFTSITGGTGADSVNITNLGVPTTINLGSGNDNLTLNNQTLTSSTSLVGGDGTDTLTLAANNSSLNAASISGFETLTLGGFNATLTLAQFAAFSTITASAGTITFSDAGSVTLNANNPLYAFANGTNTVDASAAAAYGLTGGTGADTFTFAGTLTTADTVAGGTGTDVISITATNATTDFDNVTAVETVNINAAAAAAITTVDALVAAAATLTVTQTGAGTLTWNGSAETNGSFVITGGTGNDTLTGGGIADTISGGAGNDTIRIGQTAEAGADRFTGGDGNDVFVLTRAANTFSSGIVTITDFVSGAATGNDVISLDLDNAGVINSIADITSGLVAGSAGDLNILTSSLTTSQITGGIAGNAAANAFIVVFNSSTNKAEIWFDADWTTTGARSQVATIDNITTLGGVTSLSAADGVDFLIS